MAAFLRKSTLFDANKQGVNFTNEQEHLPASRTRGYAEGSRVHNTDNNNDCGSDSFWPLLFQLHSRKSNCQPEFMRQYLLVKTPCEI